MHDIIDRERRRNGLAPRRYPAPWIDESRTGDCPVCWNITALSTAGRIRPHGGGCPGEGSLPRTSTTLSQRQAGPPDDPYWWRNPTCQVCADFLADPYGNPRWEVTCDITFVCAGGCRRNLTREESGR